MKVKTKTLEKLSFFCSVSPGAIQMNLLTFLLLNFHIVCVTTDEAGAFGDALARRGAEPWELMMFVSHLSWEDLIPFIY